jgi:hypothetical protein
MPRLYREAPLNGIWEGSGNVICLDVLRAMHRDPDIVDVLLAEIAPVAADDARIATALDRLQQELRAKDSLEVRARRVTEGLAGCGKPRCYGATGPSRSPTRTSRAGSPPRRSPTGLCLPASTPRR